MVGRTPVSGWLSASCGLGVPCAPWMQVHSPQQALLHHAHSAWWGRDPAVAQANCILTEIMALLTCPKNAKCRSRKTATQVPRNCFLTSKGVGTSCDKWNLQLRETEVLGVAWLNRGSWRLKFVEMYNKTQFSDSYFKPLSLQPPPSQQRIFFNIFLFTFFSIMVYHRIYFPLLYSRTLLFIHPAHNNLHLLISNSPFPPLPTYSTPGNHKSVLFVSLFLFYDMFILRFHI